MATTPTWTKVADEGKSFTLSTAGTVRYGAGTTWATKALVAGTYACGNTLFGDPLYGVVKACELQDVPPPAPPPPLVIANQIARKTLPQGTTVLTPDLLNKPLVISNGAQDCTLQILPFSTYGWTRSATVPVELYVCLQRTGAGAYTVSWPTGSYALTPGQTAWMMTTGIDQWSVC